MAERANLGKDVLTDAALDDIASLMKKWFREMTDLVIPNQFSDFLTFSIKDGKCIQFAAALPPVNSMTLAYLVGFLQELATHESETKMGINNLSMVFAPNIVQPNDQQPTALIGQQLLIELIQHWDVSSIYPLKM